MATETVKVPAYNLVPGNVILTALPSWRVQRQTVASVRSEPVGRGRRVYVVAFEETEPNAAPARFSQDDVFDVERVN